MDQLVQECILQGRSYYNNGEFQFAVKEFSKALEVDSNFLPAYIGRAIANDDCGDPRDTLADFETVIRLSPGSGESFYAQAEIKLKTELRADILHEKKDHSILFAAVIDLYTRAIDLTSVFPQAFFNRAELKYELGDFQGALDDYDRSIQQDHNFALAYVKRAQAKEKLGDIRGGIKDLEYYLNLPIGATCNRSIMKTIASYWFQLSISPEA